MILDTVLAKYREALQTLVQPTDNVFGQMEVFADLWSKAMAKITEFTKQAMEEHDKGGGKKPKKTTDKKHKKDDKKEDEKAEEKLAAKLAECYKFRDELRDLASIPVSIVGRVNEAASIRTDTPPEVVSMMIRILLSLFNRFLDTVNPDDPRNGTAPTQQVGVEHPHAAKLRELASTPVQSGPKKGNNRQVQAIPNKNITRTLTRPR